MDGRRTTDKNWKTLRRIVALLLALADLADRAGVRSPAVRSLVLWFLRPAEEIARDYVAGLTPADQPLLPVFADDGAADAIRLAASFRALASALAAFIIDMFGAWQPVIAALGLTATGPLAPRRHPAAAIERRDSS
jgi:hypothetical protein